MTATGWFCAGFGVCLALGGTLLIVLDVLWVQRGRPSVSERLLALALFHPIIPALLGAVLGLLLGVLLGHWFFPLIPSK